MYRDAVAILDVGSSKITALIGERSVNDNFNIKTVAEKTHEAFYDGKIVDYDSLVRAIKSTLESVQQSHKVNINELFVGVPGEFLKIRNKQYQISLNKRRKIKQKDVNELYDSVAESINEADFEIIDKSAVYYFIDGNQRVAEPVGVVSETLSGYLTFYLADMSFTKAVRDVLSELKIKTVNFVPIPLCQSLFLFSREERYAYVILCDVGYLTTSISIILGDGMLYQGAFPIGGGHVTAYLNNVLKIDEFSFSIAENLKRKINLSLGDGLSTTYKVYVGDEEYSFDVSACNDIVKSVLTGIAENVEKHLNQSQVKLPYNKNISISLTGGGIAFMRGAKEYLRNTIEMEVNVISPNIPFMNKPDESSKLSLLNYALTCKEK